MKMIHVLVFFLMSSPCCRNAGKNAEDNLSKESAEQASFFPVTQYLKGQIAEIKNRGINPLKITKMNNREDSSWISTEQLMNEFQLFLSPEIGNYNMSTFFTENRFLDQTVNAFTFSYDPKKTLPDSFPLRHWDIYIDPKTNKVSRIYLVKNTSDHRLLQLTWQSGKNCKMVTIAMNDGGMAKVEKEVLITWEF